MVMFQLKPAGGASGAGFAVVEAELLVSLAKGGLLSRTKPGAEEEQENEKCRLAIAGINRTWSAQLQLLTWAIVIFRTAAAGHVLGHAVVATETGDRAAHNLPTCNISKGAL